MRATQCGWLFLTWATQGAWWGHSTESDHKTEDNSARPSCTSEQALVSATERDKRWDSLTFLCDSQKHTTCLDIHCNACLKHLNSPTHQKNTVSPLLFTWNILATGREQGSKQLISQTQILTRSAHQTFRIRSHGSSSHCAFHIHALSLAEQSLGESVTAISPSTLQRLGSSECLQTLLPVEGFPEISLCLVPAMNRGSLRWQHLRWHEQPHHSIQVRL